MSRILPNAVHPALPVRAEKCARAVLRKAEKPNAMAVVGAVVERARQLRGWTLDELAGKCEVNARQVARWIKGQERTQFDVLFAIDDALWKNTLVIALAELGTGVTVHTQINVPLTAANTA